MRNRPALAISVLALFVALGGTGYAAFSLPRNSVGSKQLKRNAVTTSKIKNGAVTTGKLKNGAVTGPKMNFRGVIVPQAAVASSASTANNATHAANADLATNAINATNATNSTNATNAATAQTANSLPALTWTPLTMSSGFTADPGSGATPSYTKDHDGFVHLRGWVDSTGASVLITTLPAGFVPVNDTLETVMAENSTSNQILATVLISHAGNVTTFLLAGSTPPRFISFDGISFPTG